MAVTWRMALKEMVAGSIRYMFCRAREILAGISGAWSFSSRVVWYCSIGRANLLGSEYIRANL